MWNSAYTNYQVWVNFNANELLYISVKGWWSFEDIENTKKTGLCYDKKCVCSGNPGHNIWSKLKKFSKIG